MESRAAIKTQKIRIIFDGPPSHDGPSFIEVEDEDGNSVKAGEWVEIPLGGGFYALELEVVVSDA